jgi:hypothetical protein
MVNECCHIFDDASEKGGALGALTKHACGRAKTIIAPMFKSSVLLFASIEVTMIAIHLAWDLAGNRDGALVSLPLVRLTFHDDRLPREPIRLVH